MIHIEKASNPPRIIFHMDKREPFIVYDYLEAYALALEIIDAIKVFPQLKKPCA